MEIILKLYALAKAGLPLPTWIEEADVTDWLVRIAPPEAGLITYLTKQIKTEGYASVPLPNGDEVVVYANGDYCAYADGDIAEKLSAVPESAWVSAITVEKIGDGKIINWIKEKLPTIIEIAIKLLPYIPLILEPTPEPTPDVV